MIAATFPGLFTAGELETMDVRRKFWWAREAEAVRRQWVYLIARGVNIGMSTPDGFKQATAELELTSSRDERIEGNWEALKMMGGK